MSALAWPTHRPTRPTLQPVTVHGGWRLMWCTWTHDRDGWWEDYEPSDDATVYASEAAAREAMSR